MSLGNKLLSYESQIRELASAENERVRYASEISQLSLQLENLQALAKEWEATGSRRLKELEKILAEWQICRG